MIFVKPPTRVFSEDYMMGDGCTMYNIYELYLEYAIGENEVTNLFITKLLLYSSGCEKQDAYLGLGTV